MPRFFSDVSKIFDAPLAASVADVLAAIDTVPADRREPLETIAAFVRARRAAGEPATLVFICTHNSRRSHMGQLWAATAALHYGIEGVETYSGGTEATAFNPRAVATLRRAGMRIDAPPGGADNPRYTVSLSPGGPTLEAFSKTYSEPPNPTEDFAAIMTCNEADRACPFVKGAALRVALPYVDPKEADGTPQEAATYDERSAQIATEMFWLFSRVDAES